MKMQNLKPTATVTGGRPDKAGFSPEIYKSSAPGRNGKPLAGGGASGEAAKKRGPRRKTEGEGNIISLSKAAAIYKEVTGRRKSLKVLADILHERPHLAVFDFDLTSCRPHFLGVRRDRWTYFLKMRSLMYNSRDIFHSNEL